MLYSEFIYMNRFNKIFHRLQITITHNKNKKQIIDFTESELKQMIEALNEYIEMNSLNVDVVKC